MRSSLYLSLAALGLAAACTINFPTDVSSDATGPARTIFTWSGTDAAGISLNVQNGVGTIDVRPSADAAVSITATARTTRTGASLDDVAVTLERSSSGITVCSLYLQATSCAAAGDAGKTHVVIDYVVYVPAGQKLRLADGVGDISLRDADGQLMAATGVGSIDVRFTRRPTRDMDVATGTGSVTFTLPGDFAGRVDAATGVGRVSSDFPLTVIGVLVTGSLHGSIGSGGPSIKAATGVGDVMLRRQ